MNHFDAVDFCECHPEEVMFPLTLSVVNPLRIRTIHTFV